MLCPLSPDPVAAAPQCNFPVPCPHPRRNGRFTTVVPKVLYDMKYSTSAKSALPRLPSLALGLRTIGASERMTSGKENGEHSDFDLVPTTIKMQYTVRLAP